jgi:organic radical activating enzyme
LVIIKGDELKLVYPQEQLDPEQFETLDFDNFYLQPMDQGHLSVDQIPLINTQEATLHYCLPHPRWRLSLQTHKMLNID